MRIRATRGEQRESRGIRNSQPRGFRGDVNDVSVAIETQTEKLTTNDAHSLADQRAGQRPPLEFSDTVIAHRGIYVSDNNLNYE